MKKDILSGRSMNREREKGVKERDKDEKGEIGREENKKIW